MISEASCCCKLKSSVKIYNIFEIYASRHWSNTLLLSRIFFYFNIPLRGFLSQDVPSKTNQFYVLVASCDTGAITWCNYSVIAQVTNSQIISVILTQADCNN